RAPRPFRGRGAGDAYADKAISVADGTRFGIYMPEAFNLGAPRKLGPLVDAIAREKAGLAAVGPGAAVSVHEVTEVVESADRSRAVRLDGPVARADETDGRARARAMGEEACAWLAAIQAEDGGWPQRIRPRTGEG